MTAPALLRLGAAVVPIVYKEELGAPEPHLGRIVGDDYDFARYPEINPILEALQPYGWHHFWNRDDLVVLHHCDEHRFAVLEENYHEWPAHELVAIVLAAGGTLTPAPQL